MKGQRPKLQFQIDIDDFKDDVEILKTIKNILKLTKNSDFTDNIDWDNGRGVKVNVSPKISFLIRGCQCD
jgi:hypothetical protein